MRRVLKTAVGMIPEDGLPDSSACYISTRELKAAPGGEPVVLATSVGRNHLGDWQLVVDVGNSSTAMPMTKYNTNWLNKRSGRTSRQAGRKHTVVAEQEGPLFLLRLRKALELPGRTTVDMNPTDGVLVWISAEP